MQTSFEQEIQKFQYVNLDMQALMEFADKNKISYDEGQLGREISLLKSIDKPMQLHLENFKSNWTFGAMNEFTQKVKRTFTNRKFKASDANNIHFYYDEHKNKVEMMLKAGSGLSELCRLTLLRNMFKHLEYLKKGINVKAYFQLRSYLENHAHEETPASLKRKKMDLNNIYKRVDNRHHIDEVLNYEKGLLKFQAN